MTDRSPLRDLSAPPFTTRHIGPSDAEQARMLDAVGYASAADLVAEAVPAKIQSDRPLDLPEAPAPRAREPVPAGAQAPLLNSPGAGSS